MVVWEPGRSFARRVEGNLMDEESIFAAAREKRTAAERAAYLDQACHGDAGRIAEGGVEVPGDTDTAGEAERSVAPAGHVLARLLAKE